MFMHFYSPKFLVRGILVTLCFITDDYPDEKIYT